MLTKAYIDGTRVMVFEAEFFSVIGIFPYVLSKSSTVEVTRYWALRNIK